MSDEPDGLSKVQPVEVIYSGADIAVLNLMAWRFWVGMVGVIVGMLALLPVIFALTDGRSLSHALAEIDLPFIALIAAILVAWIVAASVLAYLWRRRRKGPLGPIVFSLTGDGVRFRNREMEGLVFWNAIRSIKTRADRTFLFLTSRSALILPRRAFDTDDQFDAFTSIARDEWAKQRQRR